MGKPKFCMYCGTRMYKERPPHFSVRMTRDHIFPKCDFPDLHGNRNNYVKVCFGCNNAKGDMHPFRWVMTVRNRSFGGLLDRFRLLGVPEICITGLKAERKARYDTSNR